MAMSVTQMDLKDLPNLPGFQYPVQKDSYHKGSTWAVVNGQRIEHKEGLSHDRPKFVKATKPVETWRTGSMPDSTTRQVFKNSGIQQTHTELPAWDAFDRHVLRFYGYFKEAVVETNLENFRVRKVTMYYYLEDDTCHVIEPRQDNSGIPQGQLIRRHRFPAPNGGYVKPEDLLVGTDLHVYGRVIRLTDCDGFTREYYAQLGIEQEDAHQNEVDPFGQTQDAIKVKSAAQPRTYEKVYREVMLGGGHINADMQQFLENDRRVLRFFSVLDDLSTPQFERRPFTILFFLADDQVEIRESYPLNCGRDNFPIFFRKGRLAAGPARVDGPQGQLRKKSEFVHGHDFYVGQKVTLLGSPFMIYDADEFTRQYFGEVLGVSLDEKIDVQLPERSVPRATTPPYTGYGSWDDSMSSVLHLIPKPPKKDFNKLYHNDGKIMRFTARFVNPKPEDMDRLFVVNFHLFDDTLSIHEPPQRNLGIVTGRFLEKAVHLNQATDRIFQPTDLLPGKVIKVYNHEMEILDMDDYTRRCFEDPDSKPNSYDLVAVLEKIRESMRQQFPLVRDIFRRFDADHDGVMTQPEFRRVLEKFGFILSDEEVLAVMKHFDSRKDGQVSYNEFCDAVLDEDYTSKMLKVKPTLNSQFDSVYAEKAMNKSMERSETEAVRKAVRSLGDVVYQRVGMDHRLMKEFQHLTHRPTVTCEQVQYALKQLGHAFDIVDIQRAVSFLLPYTSHDTISYVELLKSLTASFHDLSHNR